jgi:translation initiation factor 4A
MTENTTWDDFSFSEELLRGIYNCGFEKPSPIQCKAIQPIIDKKDLIAQAQSGTGKTATFVIGVLASIDYSLQENQVIIMSPVRELSVQTYSVVKDISCMIKNFTSILLIGGNKIDEDISYLKNNKPQLIVGTPGRIYDLIEKKHIDIKKISLVVIDEADEMLSNTFKHQFHKIIMCCKENVQIVLFSASFPDDIKKLSSTFLINPISIIMKSENLTLDGIAQYYVSLENDEHKLITLKDLYSNISFSQCIIYCNSVPRVIRLYDSLKLDNFPVSYIHSQMSTQERTQIFNEFKMGITRILISTNLTSRGIDIQQINLVINFDVPKCIHTYLHRIGRTGRWGRKGVAINFITYYDINKLREIESFYKCNINELPEKIII